MSRKHLILEALSSYQYGEVIDFLKTTIQNSENDIKAFILKVLSKSHIINKIQPEFFIKLYEQEKELVLRARILKIIFLISPEMAKDFFLKEKNNYLKNYKTAKILTPALKGEEFIQVILSELKEVDDEIKPLMLEKLASIGGGKTKEVLKNYIKKENELVQIAIINGINSEKFFELLLIKAYSKNPTIEIASLAKLGKMMLTGELSLNTKKNIVNLIGDKLDSSEELVKLSAVKAITFYDKKLLVKLTEVWKNIHPFYFPQVKDSVMNMLIMCPDASAREIIKQKLNIFKVKNFVNTIYKIRNNNLNLFIFKNFKKGIDRNKFIQDLKTFFKENRIFVDHRFFDSFFKDVEDGEIDYFRGLLEKIFMREFKPFLFREVDIKIISEYLDILGMLSFKFSSHFLYIKYDYIKIAIIKYIPRNEQNFSFLLECAKYKSMSVREIAVLALGEYDQALNFLAATYNNTTENIKENILKALSLGKSNDRKMFFLEKLSKKEKSEKISKELLNNIITYYDDEIIQSYALNILKNEDFDFFYKIKALNITVLAGIFKKEYLDNILEAGQVELSSNDILQLCESIKFLPEKEALKYFMLIADYFPYCQKLIQKFLFNLKSKETASILIKYYEEN
ncbi:MAG: hypothetical protein ACQESP_07680 [Candidatus Muiribacteriota bacterium]